MPIITKSIRIMLMVLSLAIIFIWLSLGPDALKYLGKPAIWSWIK